MTDFQRDDQAVHQFVERFALLMAEAGFPRMSARILVGLLAADSGRLTALELAEQLEVSPAAISGGVRYLTQLGLIVRERERGSRADHYRIANDMWYESFAYKDQVLVRWVAEIAGGVSALGAGSPAGERLDETRRFFEFVRGELPAMMAKWRALKNA